MTSVKVGDDVLGSALPGPIHEIATFLRSGVEHQVVGIEGLAPADFDRGDLTYVAAGDGIGEIETVTYYKNGAIVCTITLTYDSQNRITRFVRS